MAYSDKSSASKAGWVTRRKNGNSGGKATGRINAGEANKKSGKSNAPTAGVKAGAANNAATSIAAQNRTPGVTRASAGYSGYNSTTLKNPSHTEVGKRDTHQKGTAGVVQPKPLPGDKGNKRGAGGRLGMGKFRNKGGSQGIHHK